MFPFEVPSRRSGLVAGSLAAALLVIASACTTEDVDQTPGLPEDSVGIQDYFTSGDTVTIKIDGAPLDVNKRLLNLLRGTWDDTESIATALETATLDHRNADETGRVSAQIAAQTFAIVGSNKNHELSDGLHSTVARIIAGYASDLVRVAITGESDLASGAPWHVEPDNDSFGDGAPYGAALGPALVRSTLSIVSESDQDMHIVLAGVGAVTQTWLASALEHALHDGSIPPAPVRLLTTSQLPALITATNTMATSLGWVLDAAYDGRNSEDRAAKTATMRSRCLQAITAAPSVRPGAWSQDRIDQTTDQLMATMNVSDIELDGGEALSPADRRRLLQIISNQLLASGYWDEQYIELANGPDGTRFEAPPGDSIVANSDPPRIDFNSEAFRTWARTTFPLDAFLNSQVYPGFDDQLDRTTAQ